MREFGANPPTHLRNPLPGVGRDVLEGGEGGGSVGGGGGLAGSPLLLGSPYGPQQRRAKKI